jgi:signal transduction histidine kinase
MYRDMNKDAQKEFYEQNWHTSVLILKILCFVTLVWSAFDYINNEPHYFLYLGVRIAASVPFILTYFLLPKQKLKENIHVISILHVLAITLLGMTTTMTSKNVIGHFYPIVCLQFGAIFILRLPKLSLSIIAFIPFACSLIFQDHLSSVLGDNYRTFLGSTLASFFLISFVSYSYFGTLYNKLLLQRDLATNNLKLSSLLNEKDNLVRILCHDLGNQLAIVELSNDLIDLKIKKAGNIDPKIHKAVERVKGAVEVQKNIIDTIKQQEAISSGKQELKVEMINMNDCVTQSIETFKEAVHRKGIQIHLNQSKQYHIMASQTEFIHSILNNLLSNAIKFSHNNSVIKIMLWENNNNNYLSIQDNGVGMSPSKLNNIFRTDIKTTTPGTGGETGTGFGMPIVKTMVDKFHGEILIESTPDEGTRYTLIFPSAKLNKDAA